MGTCAAHASHSDTGPPLPSRGRGRPPFFSLILIRASHAEPGLLQLGGNRREEPSHAGPGALGTPHGPLPTQRPWPPPSPRPEPRGRRALPGLTLPASVSPSCSGSPPGALAQPKATPCSLQGSAAGAGVTPAPLSGWMPSASFFVTCASVSPLAAALHVKRLSVSCCPRLEEVPGTAATDSTRVRPAGMGRALRPPGREVGCAASSWWPFQGNFPNSHRGGGRRG